MISQKAKFIYVPAAWLAERNEFEIFWCIYFALRDQTEGCNEYFFHYLPMLDIKKVKYINVI